MRYRAELYFLFFSEIPVGGSFTPPRMCMSEDAAEAPPPDLREATARFLPNLLSVTKKKTLAERWKVLVLKL